MTAGWPSLPPSRLSAGFYTEAGRACAHYIQNGGRLRDIRMEDSRLLRSPLQLTPPPRGDRDLYPLRRELEEDLEMLRIRWCDHLGTSGERGFRFLLAFCREMEKQSPGWHSWARVWLMKNRADHRLSVQGHYLHLLSHPDSRRQTHTVCWEPCPDIDPAAFKALLEERIADKAKAMSHSRRALVIESEVMGRPVIIKRYAPNPHRWKRRWEHSRARRAWAASKTLEDLGLPGIKGLGWLEHCQGGYLQESYFICQQLPGMETLRVWLRREFPGMSRAERQLFRHRLRKEILKLHHHGLMHVDLKLSNLLVKGREVEDLVFYWIDLEDLRAGGYSRLTFIRNLYQLNGSLPRGIPRAEREAFAAGFRNLFPFAVNPRLFRYIQRKTLKRHRDELKRLQGA